MHALPALRAPVVDHEAASEERAMVASDAAHATLARLFVTAVPARPLGKEFASAMRAQSRALGRAESEFVIPGHGPEIEKLRKAKQKSLVSAAQWKMRDDLRCGSSVYKEIDGVFAKPIIDWLRQWSERLTKTYGHIAPKPVDQRTIYDAAKLRAEKHN